MPYNAPMLSGYWPMLADSTVAFSLEGDLPSSYPAATSARSSPLDARDPDRGVSVPAAPARV
ncbi:MAG: hypothetical protein M3Q29_13165 [Chloroflexota bacterium]|nr:hypothetical protein [Chloroflexota bacterium]